MTINVRPVTTADKDRWLRLFVDYIAFYRATVPAEVVAATWERLVGQSSGMMGFSAISGSGDIIGIAAVVFHPSTWSASSYCYLEDLYVDPAQRGQGVGQALIRAVYAEADLRGATRTYWVTDEENDTARRLYDAVGHLSPYLQYRR